MTDYDYEAATQAMWQSIQDRGVPDKYAARAAVDAAVPKPCKHGNRDPHLLAVLENFERVECDGKPEAPAMSDCTLYREANTKGKDREAWYDGKAKHMWVVPVEPCKHGNTGRHIDEDTIRMKDWVEGTTGYEDCEYDWCDGKPEAECKHVHPLDDDWFCSDCGTYVKEPEADVCDHRWSYEPWEYGGRTCDKCEEYEGSGSRR